MKCPYCKRENKITNDVCFYCKASLKKDNKKQNKLIDEKKENKEFWR